jgi:hypothetical protein
MTGTDRIYLLANTGVNGCGAEIVTGNEQGSNRSDNRENTLGNRGLLFFSLEFAGALQNRLSGKRPPAG